MDRPVLNGPVKPAKAGRKAKLSEMAFAIAMSVGDSACAREVKIPICRVIWGNVMCVG